jgi:CYTH domain-containing protein
VLEIERKFVLAELPAPDLLGRGEVVEQGYLVVSEGELRLRRRGGRTCYLTAKTDGGLVRHEWEQEIPEWMFAMLWKQTQGQLIKTRYTVRDGQRTLAIDDYCDGLAGLVTLECEFPTEEEAASFVTPTWTAVVREVTMDAGYKNKALAMLGSPR